MAFNAHKTSRLDWTYKDTDGEEYPICFIVKRLGSKQANLLAMKYARLAAQLEGAEESSEQALSLSMELEYAYRETLSSIVEDVEGIDLEDGWPKDFEGRMEWFDAAGSAFCQQATAAYQESKKVAVDPKSQKHIAGIESDRI